MRYFTFTALLLLVGCTSSQIKSLEKIELGMDKTDVIEEIGSPNRSFRRNDQDVWIYKIHSEDNLDYREVSFSDGHVSYIGEPRPTKTFPNARTQEEATQILKNEIK